MELPRRLDEGTEREVPSPAALTGAEGFAPDTAPPGDGSIGSSPAGQPTEIMPDGAPGRPVAAVPATVPGYRLLHRLGAGSFGEVWRAEEEGTGIAVAIKFFARGDRQHVRLLLAEVRQLASLDSVRGIVQLKDVNADAVPPYFVMAYADGGSLADRLERGPLPVALALALFRQVAEALAYVHAKGIRHCDLKPGNVLLDARGRALLADFGQAHLLGDVSPALGTLFYMAPEQADLSLQVPDARWDVYGLGSLLLAMLTGRPARYDEAVCQRLADTLDLGHRLARYRDWLSTAPPVRGHRRLPGMDRHLDSIIRRCLAIDPVRRLRDGAAVVEALDRRQRRRRQRPLFAFLVVVPLLLLGLLSWGSARSGQRALEAFEADLTAQVLSADRDSARSIALAVQDQLQERTRVVRKACDRNLYDAVRQRRSDELRTLLRHLVSRDGVPADTFAAVAVADERGRLLEGVRVQPAAKPAPGKPAWELADITNRYPQYRHWAWRDWFCGRMGVEYDPDHSPPPIRDWHISAPYVSPVFPGEMLVGISCPVRDPSSPRAAPVGVLLASIRTKQLSRWFRQVGVATGGFVVLLDRRRHCVLHDDVLALPEPLGAPRELDYTALARTTEGGETGTLAEFRDPVNGKTYLAGYAHMPDERIDWVALVQHDQQAVRRPIEALRAELAGIRWRTFLAAAVLTSVLWGWLLWILRREQLRAG
jgi:serine/threonine protein kinase